MHEKSKQASSSAAASACSTYFQYIGHRLFSGREQVFLWHVNLGPQPAPPAVQHITNFEQARQIRAFITEARANKPASLRLSLERSTLSMVSREGSFTIQSDDDQGRRLEETYETARYTGMLFTLLLSLMNVKPADRGEIEAAREALGGLAGELLGDAESR